MMILRFSENYIKRGKWKQKCESNYVGVNIRAAVKSKIRSPLQNACEGINGSHK